MKKIKILLLLSILFNVINAEDTTIKLNYETLNFDNSKKKDRGKRYGVLISHKLDNSLYQIAYDKTNTDTFQPPLKENLKVDKYYFKYRYKLDKNNGLIASYATINDNLMEQTDGGNIYGLGYKYTDFTLMQYLSDYENFNVYQTDLKYVYKKSFDELETQLEVIGKYIYLQDRDSNTFSKNAEENYFTTGFKAHAHYESYHLGIGAYFGKRAFAVMKDGFKIQHHAKEFNKTYMIGVGKEFNDFDIHIKYVYQNATEIPINNKNVEVENIILSFKYKF